MEVVFELNSNSHYIALNWHRGLTIQGVLDASRRESKGENILETLNVDWEDDLTKKRGEHSLKGGGGRVAFFANDGGNCHDGCKILSVPKLGKFQGVEGSQRLISTDDTIKGGKKTSS